MCFGLNLLPRLSTRCRGAPRRRGELRKVWDLACGFVQATKNRSPPPLTVARFGVLLPSAPSLSVFALLKPASSARPSFLLSQVSSSLAHGLSLRLSPHAFTTYTNGWMGRGTGVSPREDNLVGLVASLQSRQGYRLAVHTLAALPPGLPGQASELYYEKIR